MDYVTSRNLTKYKSLRLFTWCQITERTTRITRTRYEKRVFIPLPNPISVNSLMIKDSFSFVQELLNSDIDSSKVVMASFDVTSLFTNIPLNETIDIISNRIFSNCKRFQGLNRSEFEKLLTLSVKNCHFMFNGRLFHQIDGVAMGSPLGPLFANIFMSFHEKTWLDRCPSSFKPLLYRRYVDDCFLLFRSMDHVPLFLDYLNCQHPNISFTSEIEHEGKLPFLDIDISRSSGKFTTSVYRKPTFTGLFTNFQSFIPLTYKRSLVSCLLHRIFNLCSSYENFHAQLEVIRKLFNLNGFPSHMFDCIVRHFLDNTFQPKPSILTAPKKIIYFCLPFTGSHSLQIRTQINRLCNAAFPHLHIRFVFRSSTRISSFFPFKDKVPKFLRLVLYTLSSVDAVPRRMWVKPHVIYTPESQNTWEFLLSQESRHLALLCLASSPTLTPLDTLLLLTILKSCLPPPTHMS